MKNKQQAIKYCHADPVSASHKLHKPICHVQLVETSHLQISKLLNFQILSFFFLLFSFFCSAQSYNWQWAMSGGGFKGGTGSATFDEKIYDVKVGTDGNYYFIGTMLGSNNTQLNGVPVTTYNSSLGNNDIFLFSTTCDGTVRWKQAIGGGANDRSFNLALDSNNDVYIAADVTGGTNYNIHFSPDAAHDITPYPANQNAYKRIYLVKYNSNGVFQGKKALQGNVDLTTNQAQILDLFIDSTNKIHFIIGFVKGIHLESNITVPNTITAFQYFLAKYESSLNYIDSMLLPIADGSGFITGQIKFAYNENSNIYYIAGERNIGTNLIYDGDAIVNKAFVLAFYGIGNTNGVPGQEVWRREINSTSVNLTSDFNSFNSLVVDSNSNVYVGGNLVIHPNDTNIKIYDPTNTNIQPYFFTPGANWTLPFIVKFNSSGAVQWAQATSAHDSTISASANRVGKGISLNGNEVAFGVQGGADTWGTINIPRPLGASFQPDPVLVRLNKQTGAVINVHDIQGEAVSTKQMTAVATDNDGNYITAGTFNSNLFMNNTLGIIPLISTGEADFFVAKLAATACGTTVSTEKFNTVDVKIYPNPTTDIINIETPQILEHYEVYNVLGQQIQRGMVNSNNQVNLNGLTVGTYFVKFTTQKGDIATVKVVKR